jgi:FkbH-like protein
MAGEISPYSTLVDLLSARAQNEPEKVAFIFLSDGETEKDRISYGELHHRACTVGGYLQDSAAAGERALLLLPSGLDFLVSFFGALYAGMIAVPAYPPSASRVDGKTRRFQSIVKDAQPSRVLTTSQLANRLQSRQDQLLENIECVQTSAVDDSWAERWRRPAITAESTAFLQYTSGSTALPKGVMVSHGNILQNERMIQTQCSQSAESTVVSWLPQYHDMGLIGSLLQPLYVGSLGVFMSPSAFLQQPICWLRAISRYRAHSSGGPNFAYDLSVSRTTEDQRKDLDLSAWRVAFNGAEPVRPTTIERFSSTFAPYGFRRESFFPCYGLAEATLIVTGRPGLKIVQSDSGVGADGPAKSRQFVSCGVPVVDTQVIIVDPATMEPCPVGEIGEIWVQSPSVACGYWKQEELSGQIFGASLPGRAGAFLRTGDLGFLVDGELMVAGRLKDLIIIRGENYYPEDLELTASESHAALRFQQGAAFIADIDGGEELVLLHGVERSSRDNLEEVAGCVRDAISQNHGVRVHTVLLVDPVVIPRTSSGKVQRHICRAQFLTDSFPALLRNTIAPRVEDDDLALVTLDMVTGDGEAALFESAVRYEIASAMRLNPAQLSPARALTELGLDSAVAAEIHQKLLQRFNADVPATTLLSGATLNEIIACLTTEGHVRQSGETESHEWVTARDEGAARISVEQQRLWLLSQISPQKAAYNVSAGLPIEGPLKPEILRRAVEEVVRRHEILRASLKSTPTGPILHIAESYQIAWNHQAMPAASREEREQITWNAGLRHAEIPFDLEKGPLIRFQLLTFGPADFMLLVCAHHIIMDAESFRILFEQLAQMYRALALGRPSPLAGSTLQAADCAVWQSQSVTSKSTEHHLEYWRRQLADLPEPLDLSHGKPAVNRQSGGIGSFRFAIARETTAGLRELGKRNSSTLFMLLLSGWNAMFHRWSGRSEWIAGTPVTGRGCRELRDVIGSFAYPLLLRAKVSQDMDLQKLIEITKASLLQAYDHQDIGFTQVVASLRGQGRSSRAPLIQVMFSFIKILDEPRVPEDVVFRTPQLIRTTTDIELFVTLVERPEGLEGTIFYQSALLEDTQVEQLVDGFAVMLDALIHHPEWTPSEVALPPRKGLPVEKSAAMEIYLASSFVADPLRETLEFWNKTLQTSWEIKIAPPAQVMQQLLDPDSALSRNREGINVLLLEPNASDLDAKQTLNAMEEFQRRSSSPLVVGLCPEKAAKEETVSLWKRRLTEIPGVYVVGPEEILGRYPVETIYDEFGKWVANLPFSPEFYIAAGTVLSRKIRALTTAPYKAIVLDCDHTLWNGVCAEDGPDQVQVDGPHAFLQRFVLEQKRSGMLLCICSKNREEDVIATFAAHPSMPLALDDFVANRINWRPKSENIKSLAAELNLGLDSFIYIDDNPLECAEVESRCPGMLTLCVQQAEDIPQLLENLWAFDRMAVTTEDLRKTELYRQGTERGALEHQALTVEEFIASLELKVDITPVRAEEIKRVAQLSSRVNQFNFSMRRYSEAELAQKSSDRSAECLIARVRDRFGDYGLVGAAVFHEADQALQIEALFLSCRALGRGVEYRLLNEIGKIAGSRGLSHVEVDFQCTPRNTPAQEFITRLGTAMPVDHQQRAMITLDARFASQVSYTGRAIERLSPSTEVASAPVSAGARRVNSLALIHIATHFRSVKEIARELRSLRTLQSGQGLREDPDHASVTPATEVEIVLTKIWEEIIGVQVTDVSQDLFALGGDSLLAVRILGRIRQTFQIGLSLDELFLGPLTVRSVALAIEEARLSHTNPSTA